MTIEQKKTKYQVRYAAGQYWLLNMEQKGIPYQNPVVLNGVGAELWNRMQAGQTTDQMADHMAQQYDMPVCEIREDIIQFFKQLKAQGII